MYIYMNIIYIYTLGRAAVGEWKSKECVCLSQETTFQLLHEKFVGKCGKRGFGSKGLVGTLKEQKSNIVPNCEWLSRPFSLPATSLSRHNISGGVQGL